MNSFEVDNKVGLDVIKIINSSLSGMGEFYIIPYINCHTLFIKVVNKQLNSNLMIVPRGFSKSSFLVDCIFNNNLKWCKLLPKKMFESQLVTQGSAYFDTKIMIHDDLIACMFGTSTKQREQLMGFWTNVLGGYKYNREKNSVNARCLAMFGLAEESFRKHREDMFESTLLDRVVLIHKKLSMLEKKKILEFMESKKEINLKLIKPRKKPMQIAISIEISKKVDVYALEFDYFQVMSATRAKNYIKNFLMANAYINGRKIVNENDLEFYKRFKSCHFDMSDLSKFNKLKKSLIDNPNIKDGTRIKLMGWSRPTYYKYKKIIRDKSELENS